MGSFVIGLVLGQQVPVRAGTQNPEHRFRHHLCGDRLLPRSGVRATHLEEMVSNLAPLILAQGAA